MKAVVAAFNQEKALVGAFPVIVQLPRLIVYSTTHVTQLQFCVAEEELEPLESPPPAPMILCCEWLLLKMCGYSREERDTEQLHHADTGAKRKRKL